MAISTSAIDVKVVVPEETSDEDVDSINPQLPSNPKSNPGRRRKRHRSPAMLARDALRAQLHRESRMTATQDRESSPGPKPSTRATPDDHRLHNCSHPGSSSPAEERSRESSQSLDVTAAPFHPSRQDTEPEARPYVWYENLEDAMKLSRLEEPLMLMSALRLWVRTTHPQGQKDLLYTTSSL